MKKSKKIEAKLQARMNSYQQTLKNPNVKANAYHQPGSRNGRKGNPAGRHFARSGERSERRLTAGLAPALLRRTK